MTGRLLEKYDQNPVMCPAMMPTKNTKVTPNDTPHILIFPKTSPTAEISEITITA